jgi:UDP-N-acetylmuramoyl-L-alanyl-D-glutamate--2,6-diaminopimelate ligase
MRKAERTLENASRADPDVARLKYDSRTLCPGDGGVIFACAPGENSDGHDFAGSAISSGAVALLCERGMPFDVPQIILPNVRAAMGEAAAILYGRPSAGMTMIGLTGTNGKTTCAYLIRSIVRASGQTTGMLGTIVYDDGREETFAGRTTPEGPDIQEMLSSMAGNGVECCVMEASSHGLDQGRLSGCLFDRAGFSNLTPEHLEYHSGMENYFEAKRLLFTEYANRGFIGAVNADDEYGLRLLGEFQDSARPFSAALPGTAVRPGVYSIVLASQCLTGMSLDARCPDGREFSVTSPLIGPHNAYNIIESIAIADSLGIDAEAMRRGIAECPRVPGRLERYCLSNGVTVFVDFAHSPDGMKQTLDTLSRFARGGLRVLWGAGGDRSPLKRPEVGEIMARYADHVIVTTDNPRSEDPADIARDVERGVRARAGRAKSDTILDRRDAIYFALDSSEPGDILLIAGKGPERFVEYKDRKVPFSDTESVLEWAGERSLEVSG